MRNQPGCFNQTVSDSEAAQLINPSDGSLPRLCMTDVHGDIRVLTQKASEQLANWWFKNVRTPYRAAPQAR